MNTSLLEQELAPLEAQIEKTRQKLEALKIEARAADGELSAFWADKERFDALGFVCDALDRLGELEADGLFWDEIPGAGDRAGLPAGHLERMRARVAGFDEETVRYVAKLVDRNEYKRRQAVPGVRITRRAFGRDRRYPITSGYGKGAY